MEREILFQFSDPVELYFTVNYDRKIVTILSGECKSKQEFLDIFHENALLFLIQHIRELIEDLELTGDCNLIYKAFPCVIPEAWDIMTTLCKSDKLIHERYEKARTIARQWFHSLDDFELVKKIG